MEVRAEPFEDVGDRDEHGFYDCCNRGTIFTFSNKKVGVIARQYLDQAKRGPLPRSIRWRKGINFLDRSVPR